MPPTFAAVLDQQLNHRHVPPPVERGPAPDVGRGLSSGVWWAMLSIEPANEVPVPPAPTALRPRVSPAPTPRRTTPTPPGTPRWSFIQQDAMDTLRSLGAELDQAPTLREVKRAWWALARALHPDHNQGSSEADTRDFCRAQQAWEILRPGPRPPRREGFQPLW